MAAVNKTKQKSLVTLPDHQLSLTFFLHVYSTATSIYLVDEYQLILYNVKTMTAGELKNNICFLSVTATYV